MLKEKGYDEFLAQKIQQGLDDVKNGRVTDLTDANAEWQALIEQFEQENRQFEREMAYA